MTLIALISSCGFPFYTWHREDVTEDSDVSPLTVDAPDDTGADTGDTGTPPAPGVWCYSLASRSDPATGVHNAVLVRIDTATGAATDITSWPTGTGSFHTFGMTRDATGFATAAYNGNDFDWLHLDLGGAAVWTAADIHADEVVYDGAGYIAIHGSVETMRYATWADLLARKPSSGLAIRGVERLAADGGLLYGAWHSTDTVTVFDAATGATVRQLPLAGWDTWVRGMSVAGGLLWMIDDGRQDPDQRLAGFDPVTGAMVTRIPTSGGLTGLYCSASPTP